MDEHATPQRSDPGFPSLEAESPYPQLFNVSPFPAVVTRVHDHTVLAINARTSEVVGIPQRMREYNRRVKRSEQSQLPRPDEQ